MVNTIHNLQVVGGKVGVSVRGSASVNIQRASFDNVETPYDIDTTGEVRIQNTSITNDPKQRRSEAVRGRSFVGYEPSFGAPLPAMCPRCQSIFPSKNYKIRSPAFYGYNNAETCPSCGCEDAKVANGLFDLAKETARIIQAEAWSHEMLASLVAAADKFLEGIASYEETALSFSQISPALGTIWSAAWQGSLGLAAILAVYFQVMGQDLAQLQNYLGQSPERDAYQIEKVCLDAFGEAAKCRVEIYPVDNRGVSEMNAGQKSGQVTHPPQAGGEAKGSTYEIELPATVPIPKPRPEY